MSGKVVSLHADPLAASTARLQRIIRANRARVSQEIEERLDLFLALDPSKAAVVNLTGLPFPVEAALRTFVEQLDALETFLTTPKAPK